MSENSNKVSDENIYIVLDTNLNVVDWNEGSNEIANREHNSFLNKSLEDLFPGFKESGLLSRLKTNNSYSSLQLIYKLNDKHLLLQVDINPTQNGRIIIAKKIIERTLSEKIIEAEKKYRSTFNNLIEGCTIFDKHWNYIYVNDIGATHSRLSKEEMLGKTLFEAIPGIKNTSFFKAYNKTMEERIPHQLEDSFTFQDGSTVWLEIQSLPVEEGILILSMDISYRKQIENKYRENAERFQTLADNISQLAWMADSTGWIFWYNKRWYEYTGTDFQEMKGWGWQKVHHPDHIDRVVKKFKDAIENEKRWEDTFPLRSKEGEYRWFLSRALPVFDKDGKILRWFGTNTDITENRLVQKQLEDANKLIEGQLTEKEVLLKEIHHRTKNNMQIITSLLGLKAESVVEKKFKYVIDDIKNRIRSIALVHEKLYQSKNLSGINLKEYITDLADLLSKSYTPDADKIKFILNLDEAEVTIETAIPVGLIITELITNSLKHAFPKNNKGKIEIVLKKSDNWLQLIVADDGVGFEMVAKHEEKLGLQLFRNIAEGELDGTIDLDLSKGVKWSINFKVD